MSDAARSFSVRIETTAWQGCRSGKPYPSSRVEGQLLGSFKPLVGRLEKQQESNVLPVVAIRKTCMPQDIAVIPELGDPLL